MAFEVRHSGGLIAPAMGAAHKAGKGMFDRWQAGLQNERARMQQSDQQFMARTMMSALQNQQQFQQEQQMMAMRNQAGKDLFDYEMTAKQKQRFEDLNAELDWVDDQKDWDPSQKAYARDAIRSKMIGLSKPRLIPKQDTTPASQIIDQQVVTRPDGVYIIQKDGKIDWKPLPKPDGGAGEEDGGKQLMAQKQAAAKYYKDLMSMKDANGELLYNKEDAKREALRYYGLPTPEKQEGPLTGSVLGVDVGQYQQRKPAVPQQAKEPTRGDFTRAISMANQIDEKKLESDEDKAMLRATIQQIESGVLNEKMMVVLQILKAKAQ